MIICPHCNRQVATLDWAAHKSKHKTPVQSQIPLGNKKLMKAADKLFDVMQRAGGGSIGIIENGVKKEIIRIPPKP